MLMDSWRKRMTKGDTINLDEFKMGLGFGDDLESDGIDDISVIEEEEEDEEEEEENEDEAIEDGSSVFNEEVDDVDPTPEAEAASENPTASNIFSLKLRPDQAALKETNGNKSPSRSPRKVAFSASIPNTPSHPEDENTNGSGVDVVNADTSSQPTPVSKAPRSEERAARSPSQAERTPRHVRCDEMCDQIIKMASKVTFSSSPSLSFDLATIPYSNYLRQTKKRLSSPHAHPDERSPKLSMQDKLKACQAEAEAAAVSIKGNASNVVDEREPSVEVEEEKKARRASRSPTKTRIGGRPKRRKSTLTPAELENLLGC
jgi:hypothetical protein